ncbi:MAG: hypothetical protein CFH01_00452 [Alphaproteobacteria bacterium MarineAlpha2_Bin1]|nr:MAG: hypothetical protein CFH01_00452 [Alphaproteobacteria bacterium MarineAlpha2_Bin1]
MIKRKINEILTITGLSQRGLFIPHRYVSSFKTKRYDGLEKIFKKYEPKIKENIQLLIEYEELLSTLENSFQVSPRWDQDWFPRLDAASTYLMVRKKSPKKIVEIGSGHSTRFIAKGVRDNKNFCELICIDPKPRANISNIPFLKHIESKIQDLKIDKFSLDMIDILFIDSSHILMPGSDVDIIFNHIIPQLKEGCLVHIHDIFLPEVYPNLWNWRNYNEQSIVASILFSGNWHIEWSSNYINKNLKDDINKTFVSKLPLVNGAIESSLWLEKK